MEKRRKVRKIAHKSCRIVSISFFELIYYSNCATENMREYWLVSPLIILKSTGTDRKSVHQANKWNTHDTNSYIFTCITFLMTKGCHNVNVNCRNVLLVFVSIFFGKPISSFVYRAFELEKKHMSKQMMLCSGQI